MAFRSAFRDAKSFSSTSVPTSFLHLPQPHKGEGVPVPWVQPSLCLLVRWTPGQVCEVPTGLWDCLLIGVGGVHSIFSLQASSGCDHPPMANIRLPACRGS